MDYKIIKTTASVWTAIKAAHDDLIVFGSYSAPSGDSFGDPSKGKMFTSLGFKNGDWPIIQAETTWDIDHSDPCKRPNEKHEYWLCIPSKCDEC